MSHYEVKYTEKNFSFTPQNNKLRLRITQEDLPFGDTEKISLTACQNTLTPEYAHYVNTLESVLEDIMYDDLNVIVNHNTPVELLWNTPIDCSEEVILSLKANEYESSEDGHFRFPDRNHGQEIYKFNNSLTIELDGYLTEVDGIIEPSYSDYWRPVTGHPDNYVYFYVNDDSNYVYFSADILSDNTNETEDWFETSLYDDNGVIIRTYRVSDFDSTYGKCNLGLTSNASYKHQTCELRIPKSDIEQNYINFSIQYYGTVAGDTTPPEIDISGGTSNPTTDTTPQVIGTTTDAESNIFIVQYQVDAINGIWVECTPDDGTYDSNVENFTCNIAPDLSLGPHIIYLRAENDNGIVTPEGEEPSYEIVIEEVKNTQVTFHRDTRCLWSKPPKASWITSEQTIIDGVKGAYLTWSQNDADKITIEIDDGSGSYPWKVSKTSNDGHEFLPNVGPGQKIRIKPHNHCKSGDYSTEIMADTGLIPKFGDTINNSGNLVLEKIGCIKFDIRYKVYYLTSNNLVLLGMATPNSQVELIINDQAIKLQTNSDGLFTYDQSFPNGQYKIKLQQDSNVISFNLYIDSNFSDFSILEYPCLVCE